MDLMTMMVMMMVVVVVVLEEGEADLATMEKSLRK